MRELGVAAFVTFLGLGTAAFAGGAVPAPAVFVSANKFLTFHSPAGGLICPLPKDWVGSDHGTTIFLASPGDCGGTGFPSSSRAFSIDAPRIDVYYQYWSSDPPTPPPRCRRPVGRMTLFGKNRPLCRRTDGRMIELYTSAGYMADLRAWVELSVLTTPKRLKADLNVLRQVTASVEPCRQTWTIDGQSTVFGTGKECPKDGRFF